MLIRIISLLALLFLQTLAFAAPAEGERMTAEQFEATLKYRQGTITLPGNRAVLEVPDSFRYLDPQDAERLLVNAWGNPPGSHSLGMLIPKDTSPLSANSWGVVITYLDDGHVSDDEADSIDFGELLQNMQEGVRERNKERERKGYGSLELVGWAEPPHYDKASHKLYWAKELKFAGEDTNTLNYCIRVLGRDGVLELNAVASVAQLGTIKTRMRDVLAFTNFKGGQTYADFNPASDKVATYGLATLIGGAVAAKTGLIAKLIAMLLAAKKLVIVALLGVVAFVRKLFGGKPAT